LICISSHYYYFLLLWSPSLSSSSSFFVIFDVLTVIAIFIVHIITIIIIIIIIITNTVVASIVSIIIKYSIYTLRFSDDFQMENAFWIPMHQTKCHVLAVPRRPWYQRQSDPDYTTHKVLLANRPTPRYSLDFFFLENIFCSDDYTFRRNCARHSKTYSDWDLLARQTAWLDNLSNYVGIIIVA